MGHTGIDAKTKLTYLGHSTFLIQTPEGKRILIDPWLKDNPACPEQFKKIENLGSVDIMLISHGHFDHMGDAVEVGKKFQPATLSNFEICTWLEKRGLANTQAMNKGGLLAVPGHEKIKVTLCHALHSSSIQDGEETVYGGEAGSFLIELENGRKIFHAGDTMLFSDMRLIGEFYGPEIGLIPIGSRFTMGPREAARACEYLGIKKVIPMHYRTFPLLTGTAVQFRETLSGTGIDMIELKPGESY